MLHDGTLVDELADECGGARDHEGENGVRSADDSTRAAVRILDNARIDVERGDLHPSKVRAHLEERLRALEPIAKRAPLSPAAIVRAWAAAGRLEHFPIGLSQIDEATGGGLVRGTRWIIIGAPNAGKTALAAHIVRRIAEQGLVVGILAVDEPPDRFAARLAQQCGFTREECEQREPYMLEQMAQRLEPLGLRIYDRSWTIEEAADDVARAAEERGGPGLLAIDSLQTVRCERERKELEGGRVLPITAATEARVQALRDVTEGGSRLMVVATSEMVRSQYRKKGKGDDELDLLAAGKNSGAIEYAALVQITMRPLAKHDGVIQVEIPKNKEGDGRDRTVERKNELYLELDRASQTLTEAEKPEAPSDDSEAKREDRADAQKHADAAIVATVLAKRPGLNATELRPACRAEAGTISNDRVNVAVAALIAAGAVVAHRSGGGVAHYLDGRKVPEEVLRELEGAARNAVPIARPPEEDGTGVRPEVRAAVLEALAAAPGLSVRRIREEVASRAQARRTAIDEALATMLEEGAIENRGTGSRAAYHVAEACPSTVSVDPPCPSDGHASEEGA